MYSVEKGNFLVIYKRARDLAIAGLLQLEEKLELPEQQSELYDFLEVQTAMSFAANWGSLILVYYGAEVPVYIARLPPVHYFYVNTDCTGIHNTKIKDEILLRFWAYLALGKLDKAFGELGTPCLTLDRPRGTCLSYAIQSNCGRSVKAKLSPSGIVDESNLPLYLRGEKEF
jgi:hypothetical protein